MSNIESLVEMGFSRFAVIDALNQTNQNIQGALEHLLNHSNPISKPFGNEFPILKQSYLMEFPVLNEKVLSVRSPIQFSPHHLLSDYLAMYNKFQDDESQKMDANNCQAIGGFFTYYNDGVIIVAGEKKLGGMKAVYEDMGWGCAWRSTINVLTAVKDWLRLRHNIVPLSREKETSTLSMENLLELKEELKPRLWMEPHDNAEMFLLFIEKWYSKESQERILKLIQFRGHLFLSREDRKRDYIDQMKKRHVTKKTQLKRLMAYYNNYRNANLSSLEDTLSEFYERVHNQHDIVSANFPKFHPGTNPFPANGNFLHSFELFLITNFFFL